jgi:hypothetical protein
MLKNGEKKIAQNTYFKYSPLLDPIKYLVGKYDLANESLLSLPAHGSSSSHAKIRDPNNSAYVDGFFTYLSSKLLHEHEFVHGLDYYGSFTAYKRDFQFNIVDDLEDLYSSTFFHKQNKILYELDENTFEMLNCDTRTFKKKLKFEDLSEPIDLGLDIVPSEPLSASHEPASHEPASHDVSAETVQNEVYSISKARPSRESINDSSCSSRSSNSSQHDVESSQGDVESLEGDVECLEGDGDVESSEGDGESCEDEDEDEDSVILKIKQFPVHVIALEQCESTLDSFIAKNDVTEAEWESIVLQILFSLITFQKTFGLTHNDLHTNNIMYVPTEVQFLYYKLNHVYYKVPTFGKLFKIIDFGRAIYKFRGQLMCSDSYHSEGDAATQYNCEPYLNPKKPRVEPNFSFDLCRLGCALYDYIVDEPVQTKIIHIMLDWCKDDKNRNILYKSNGEERYPDFKLYKMIARTVHKHVPSEVVQKPLFDKYIFSKRDCGKIMDIDAMPCYM